MDGTRRGSPPCSASTPTAAAAFAEIDGSRPRWRARGPERCRGVNRGRSGRSHSPRRGARCDDVINFRHIYPVLGHPKGSGSLAPFCPRHLPTIGKSPPLVMRDYPRALASPAVILDGDLLPGYHAFETDETDRSTQGARSFSWHDGGKRILHPAEVAICRLSLGANRLPQYARKLVWI